MKGTVARCDVLPQTCRRSRSSSWWRCWGNRSATWWPDERGDDLVLRWGPEHPGFSAEEVAVIQALVTARVLGQITDEQVDRVRTRDDVLALYALGGSGAA